MDGSNPDSHGAGSPQHETIGDVSIDMPTAGLEKSSENNLDKRNNGPKASTPQSLQVPATDKDDKSPIFPNTRSGVGSPDNNRINPFFHYTSQSPYSQSHFSLHSSGTSPNSNSNDMQGLYNNYGTTLTVIIILHIIYFYQWNKRSSRKEVSTSYDQLVDKKQFYRAAVALMSHPPVDGGERDTGDTQSLSFWTGTTSFNGGGVQNGTIGTGSSTDVGNGLPSANYGPTNYRLLNNIFQILRRLSLPFRVIVNRILRPLISGSLSGLPLLAFISHVLWQCRALEELYDVYDGKLILGVANNADLNNVAGIGTNVIVTESLDSSKPQGIKDSDDNTQLRLMEGYTYFRVLVALTLTSVFLEMSLLRTILQRVERFVDLDGLALGGSNSPHQLLSQRAICSLASLAAAVLVVYDSNFPNAPPPLIPFIRVSFFSSSALGLIIFIAVLSALCHRIHPITSVASGLLSGSLWFMGVTSFLGTKYWGNVMIYSLVAAFLFSLKAQPSCSNYLGMFIPCLDYVAWDRDGNIYDVSASSEPNSLRRNVSSMERDTNDESSDGDLEMGSSGLPSVQHSMNSTDRSPLLSQSSSSMSGSSIIRGRVPLMNAMDSDINDDGDMLSNSASMPAVPSRFGAGLSRRGGGSGN